ncbi:Carbonyl reductase [NADPH] 3 [Phlyctochytrium planicorne]|nr:Carbonyl reductase [NADPH] 3 [Phlyctochytrium planicorne]
MLSHANNQVFLVTGANKGIGFAIVKGLAKALEEKNATILMGCRNVELGKAALLSLEEMGFKNLGLIELDIADLDSIKKAKDEIVANYGGIDVLVNNAAIFAGWNDAEPETAVKIMKTNYTGTYNMTKEFLPVFQPQGRIINVSSEAGRRALEKFDEGLKTRFLKDDLTFTELDAMIVEYITNLKQKTHQQTGWSAPAYIISKIALNMQTRIFARETPRENVLINAVNPGWVKTDMGGPDAAMTPEQAAERILHLCFIPAADATHGKFWTGSPEEGLVSKPWS